MKPQLIPVTPAHAGSLAIPQSHALNNPNLCMAIIAILMNRAGVTEMSFSQKDFDEIAGLVLLEGRGKENEFLIGLGYKQGAEYRQS